MLKYKIPQIVTLTRNKTNGKSGIVIDIAPLDVINCCSYS